MDFVKININEIIFNATPLKVKLGVNEIKKEYFDIVAFLIPSITEYDDGEKKINWVKTSEGYLYFYKNPKPIVSPLEHFIENLELI